MCNCIHLHVYVTLAPCFTSSSSVSTKPFSAAMCNGVNCLRMMKQTPFKFTELTKTSRSHTCVSVYNYTCVYAPTRTGFQTINKPHLPKQKGGLDAMQLCKTYL